MSGDRTLIDTEPNDDTGSAAALEVGIGTGHLGPGDPADVYSTAALPELVSVDLLAPGHARLEVLVAGQSLDENATTRFQPRSRINAVRTGSDVSLLIAPIDSDVAYDLHVQRADLRHLEPLLAEPCDPASPATLTSGPQRWTGFYDGPGDVDAIAVDPQLLEELGGVSVEVSPVAGVRPVLRLVDLDTGVLAEWAAERVGQGTGVPNLGGSLGERRLQLQISAAEGAFSESPYTLSVHSPDRGEFQYLELEPNDTAELAQRIGANRRRRGFFHVSGDVDTFSLRVRQESSLSILATPDADTDISLSIRQVDENGDLLEGTEERLIEDQSVGGMESLCTFGLEAGMYQIEVAGRVSLGGRLPVYELDVGTQHRNIEREPNNRPSLRGVMELQLDERYRGYISPASDVDVFELDLRYEAIDLSVQYRIAVDATPGLDLELTLMDDAGMSIGVAANNGIGESEVIEAELPLGLYYVRVSAREGTSCEEPYRLSVTR